MSDVSDPNPDIERVDLQSLDVAEQKRLELLRLFPEVRTEGGKIALDRLKLTLGTAVDVGKERYGLTWPGKAVHEVAGYLKPDEYRRQFEEHRVAEERRAWTRALERLRKSIPEAGHFTITSQSPLDGARPSRLTIDST
jgi:hypothetical protein